MTDEMIARAKAVFEKHQQAPLSSGRIRTPRAWEDLTEAEQAAWAQALRDNENRTAAVETPS